MESRWYIDQGETVEDTKIENRTLALHATASAWSKITGHLDRKRLVQEKIDKEEHRRKCMEKASKSMTEHWADSIENIRKRKHVEREKRLAKRKEDKMQQFFQSRKEQEGIKKKLVEDIRKRIYASKGYPKDINSALIASEVFYERQKQIEVEQLIKEHNIEELKKEARKVREGVVEEKKENLEKMQKLRAKKLKMKELYLKEMKEHEEKRETCKQERIKKELLDNIHAKKEMEELDKYKAEELKQQQLKIKKELEKHLEKKQEQKLRTIQEEKETDEIIAIYAAAKDKLACLRKQKEKQMLEDVLTRNAVVAEKVVADRLAKGNVEEELLKKAAAEKEEIAIEKLLARAEFDKQMRQDRLNDRKQYKDRVENKIACDVEIKKWEMLNRYKKEERTKQYEVEKSKKNWEKVLKYRETLFKQMAEVKEREAKEIKERHQLAIQNQQKIEAEDKQFFEYAKIVYNDAKNRGRLTIPIEHVVDTYKKNNLLVWPTLERSNCVHMEAHSEHFLNTTPGKMCHDPKSDPNFKSNKSNNAIYE